MLPTIPHIIIGNVAKLFERKDNKQSPINGRVVQVNINDLRLLENVNADSLATMVASFTITPTKNSIYAFSILTVSHYVFNLSNPTKSPKIMIFIQKIRSRYFGQLQSPDKTLELKFFQKKYFDVMCFIWYFEDF